MRHLVTFPDDSSTIVAFGCSECHWLYEPKAVDEVFSGAALWNGQVLFEVHDCERFKVWTVEAQQLPKKRNFAAEVRKRYEAQQRTLRELWRDYRP
jgi:hypothetical protein